MRRDVQPELLDSLPAAAPQAVRSRADLRRLNFIMGHAGILSHAFQNHHDATLVRSRPLRLVELGAGDGTLMLHLARRWSVLGVTAQVTLLDRQNLVSVETRAAFAALNWSVESVAADVFAWLEETAPPVDVMLANLFLHHFPDRQLAALLGRAAARTKLFIACEPRRSPLSLAASRLLWLMGCNAITRHDARVSVQAGFTGHDLSTLWPQDSAWQSSEQAAGWFSHCFIAKCHG
ncbi:MAG: methyltransferase domain-containing protein [Akkermansiaceae bacterium]|nr:methyltransferase domain-containing protein [Akkermansiaceae bacterium]